MTWKLPTIISGIRMEKRPNIPMGISAYRLAKDTGIPQTRVADIIHGRRRVTADTALRLGKYFGVSARFWLGLQDDYDLEEELETKEDEIKRIPTLTTGLCTGIIHKQYGTPANPRICYRADTTPFLKMPICSISISTVSPGEIGPTPLGVPVSTRSPVSSVILREM